jgi:hypothetical protein
MLERTVDDLRPAPAVPPAPIVATDPGDIDPAPEAPSAPPLVMP